MEQSVLTNKEMKTKQDCQIFSILIKGGNISANALGFSYLLVDKQKYDRLLCTHFHYPICLSALFCETCQTLIAFQPKFEHAFKFNLNYDFYQVNITTIEHSFKSGGDTYIEIGKIMENEYIPPKVWAFDGESGGTWAKINQPTSGATHEKNLPVGAHPLQLYSMGTPNGQKVTIMLEELLALGESGAEYDAHMIEIGEGEQFSSGFVEINPNSKIPALLDVSAENSIPVFESGSILLYLAEKFGHLLPAQIEQRTKVFNWLFWLQGAAPYLGGGFGHFYAYAPMKIEYPINRFTMEIKRQLDLLDKQLASTRFIAGDDYSIADIAIWPWYGNLVRGVLYDAAEFLDVKSYKNVQRWAEEIFQRPAVQRGRIVNRTWGEPWEMLRDRHDGSDITNILKLKP